MKKHCLSAKMNPLAVIAILISLFLLAGCLRPDDTGEGEGEGEGESPAAAFATNHSSGVAPLIVQFEDLSMAGSGAITSWVWNFGNPASGADNASAFQNPVYSYNAAGTYTVSLTVFTASGSDTTSHNITVSPGQGEIVSQNVRVVDDISTLTLDTASGDDYVFIYTGNGVVPVKPGDILVGTDGDGYLRRVSAVKSVQTKANGTKSVSITTEFCSLNEVVRSGTLKLDAPIQFTETTLVNLAGKVLYDENGLLITITAGTVNFAPAMDVQVKIEDWLLKYVKAAGSGTLTLDFAAEIAADYGLSWNPPDDVDLVPPIKIPFLGVIAGVPVKGTVELSFAGGASVDIPLTFTVEAGFNSSTTITVGGEFDSNYNPPLRDVSSLTLNALAYEPVWSAEADVNARVYVKPQLLVSFYGTAAPFIGAEPYVEYDMRVSSPPVYASLTAGFNAYLGFKLGILAIEWLTYTWELPIEGPAYPLYNWPEAAETVAVPNVVGMTQSAAETAITGALLALGPVTQQYSASIPAGQVISQVPVAGTNVAQSTPINLTVSLGAGGNVAWGTYLGGAADDYGYGIAADTSGNVYVTGYTWSSGWVSNGWNTTHNGGYDGYVVKLNASGAPLWSTYLGGTDYDAGYGIAVDTSGNVYVTGSTFSPGWVTGGWDTTHNGREDGYIVKLNTSGAPLWSTYLGGADRDFGSGIAADTSGNVYVTGKTSSPGWVSNGWDTSYGGGWDDGYLVKLNASGAPLWSTYLGGTGTDYSSGIAVDFSGNVYATGYTSSPGWVSNGWDTTYNGGVDGYVVKLNTSGAPLWSTYLGGADWDFGLGIAVDSSGNVYVTGHTSSPGWVSNGWDTSYDGGWDGYVVKLNASGAHLWSTYMGGTDDEYSSGIAVDTSGNVYATGYTSSPGWVSNGWDTTHNGSWDGYLVKFNASGAPLWSTYLGGAYEDGGYGIAADTSGNVYVTGYTYSPGWVSNGWDTTHNGGTDGFVLKIIDPASAL